MHIYENTTATSTGITIEQDGTGDAVTHYELTGLQIFSVGIDNSDFDDFKISNSLDLGTGTVLTINSTTGDVTIANSLFIGDEEIIDDGDALAFSGDVRLNSGDLDVSAGNLIVSAGNLILDGLNAPASAGATGTVGTIAWDASYIYVCIATDTWERSPLSTWA